MRLPQPPTRRSGQRQLMETATTLRDGEDEREDHAAKEPRDCESCGHMSAMRPCGSTIPSITAPPKTPHASQISPTTTAPRMCLSHFVFAVSCTRT